MCATFENLTTDAAGLPPRRRKDTLLPVITRLALGGESGRAIARKLELPERTVNHWLREVRREWSAKAAADTAEMLGSAVARLESVYGSAMEAFAASQADKETQLVTETERADGGSEKKRSLRTETRSGNAALLGRATEAAKAIYLLLGGGRLPRTGIADGQDELIPAAAEKPEDSKAATRRWQGLAQVTGLDADSCYRPSSVQVTPKGLETPVFSAVS